jgi:hypothetical protein
MASATEHVVDMRARKPNMGYLPFLGEVLLPAAPVRPI